MFPVEHGGPRIAELQLVNMNADNVHYNPIYSSHYSSLDIVVRVVKREGPWKDMFLSEKRRDEVHEMKCRNRVLRDT